MLISTYIYKFLFIYSYICNIYAMPCNFLEILIRVLDCDTPLHILPLIHSSLRWIGNVLSNPHSLQMMYIIYVQLQTELVFPQDLDQMPGPRILLTQVFLFRPKLLLLVKIFSDLYKLKAKADLLKTANTDLHKNIIAAIRVIYVSLNCFSEHTVDRVCVCSREGNDQVATKYIC